MNPAFQRPKTIRIRKGLAAWVCLILSAFSSHAQTSGANGSHDPSRMLESEGKVYIYSTGGGGKASSDGLVWANVSAPAWNRNLHPNNQGIWAPDGLYLNGQYYLYGSMWSDDKSSDIVLITSPTLNPDSPEYKWTDRGIAIPGPKGVTHSVIDPAPILDQDGNLWVVFGGGYPFANEANSIWLTPMDKRTGLALASDPGFSPTQPGYPLLKGHKEGPYIHFHDGYYYLWWQTGSCCSGTASSYTMHVARSRSIKGPYTGDRVFFGKNAALNINGPGHMGIYGCKGEERFTYHYYPTNGSVVGENLLTWGSDGWPVAGARATAPIRLGCLSTRIANRSGESLPDRIRPDQVRVRRESSGFSLYIPEQAGGADAALLDPRGRRIRALPAVGGWNAVPGRILAPGLNVIRISLDGQSVIKPLSLLGG